MTEGGRSLFEPVRLGPFDLANRIVLAPLTRGRATDEGLPTELHAVYYGQRSGAGLLITEATQISPEGQGYLRTPGIHSDEQVTAWRPVTERVHAAGSRIFLQLWHVGRCAHPSNRSVLVASVAPSALAPDGTVYTRDGSVPIPVPRALGLDEMARLRADYVAAALNARRAGFDGVEIHAANGYLIDQFLHASSNRRTDRYGGSLENRTRLLLEVATAVAEAVGRGRTGVRLSPFGTFNDVSDPDPEALFDAAIAGLDTLGLAYLHVINPEVAGDRSASEGAGNVAHFARIRFRGMIIAAGGYDRRSAEADLSCGSADLVAFGRAFIANPDLPMRLREGRALSVADRATFYTSGPGGYIDYLPLEPSGP